MLIDAVDCSAFQHLKRHHGSLIHLSSIFSKSQNIIRRTGHDRPDKGRQPYIIRDMNIPTLSQTGQKLPRTAKRGAFKKRAGLTPGTQFIPRAASSPPL